MLKVGGFIEYSQQEQLIFDNLKDLISNEYKSYGYGNIETPAVEKNSVLTAKSGTDAQKQIFGLYGFAQGPEDLKDYSLHFDLTIPFARYIIDRSSQLTFPFKRSQIQKVWRGERSQRGRFREFYQADIDVVWQNQTNTSPQKYIYYDSEVIFIGYNTLLKIFNYLKLNKKPVVYFSNRNVLTGLGKYIFNNDNLKEFFDLIDNYFKIGKNEFEKGLFELGLNADKVNFINGILEENNLLDKLISLKKEINNNEFEKGLEEIQGVISNLKLLSKNNNIDYQNSFIFDLKIVRGLDYYTGTVFETYISDDIGLGSLYSGGRYDNITEFIDKKHSYGGVGASIGLSRVMSIFVEGLDKSEIDSSVSDILFLNFEDNFEQIIKLYSYYKKSKPNLKIEIFPYSEKIGKQITFAIKKGIRYIVIFGKSELNENVYKIKDLKKSVENTNTLPY